MKLRSRNPEEEFHFERYRKNQKVKNMNTSNKNPTKTTEVKKQSEFCYEVDVFPNMFFLNEVYINMILNSLFELLVEFLTQNTVLGKRFVKNHQLRPSFWTKSSG